MREGLQVAHHYIRNEDTHFGIQHCYQEEGSSNKADLLLSNNLAILTHWSPASRAISCRRVWIGEARNEPNISRRRERIPNT